MEHSEFHTSWPKKYDLNIQSCIPNISNCPFKDPRNSTLEIVNECNQPPKNRSLAHIHTKLNPKTIDGFGGALKLNSKFSHQQIPTFLILASHSTYPLNYFKYTKLTILIL
jgi:hypothetical protein